MRFATLISGRGSNMQALLEACAEPGHPAKPAIVISNKADAAGLEIARAHGVPTKVISHKDFPSRHDFEAALHQAIVESGAEMICLAGFMRLLEADFVDRWRDRILNIHPSLLPAYRGLHTHQRVLEDGVRFSGCTVHFVRPEMDAGPIVFQACVPVREGDTEDSLGARVLAWEHKLYPLALRLMAEGKLRVEGKVVHIDAPLALQDGLMNPCPERN
ncbi:phosphoribosylglycinamide formyltransferase [Emcibacter sp. SYSU 3D8]|uniref:phosphoribosylglycinamide formyltransferase n=1 Tax=Emcibacter sp. SYSU 3D8 TaxID=3133969 RepID=UPI0031FEFBAF